MANDKGEIVIYQTDDGHTKLEVRLEDETVWLTQAQLVELYQTSKSNISEHIKHIFEEGELEETSVVRKFRTTASDGKKYNTTFYNLDMIISLGYRVKSSVATKFRQWATQRLKEYMIKGFALDDERLKGNGGGGHFPADGGLPAERADFPGDAAAVPLHPFPGNQFCEPGAGAVRRGAAVDHHPGMHPEPEMAAGGGCSGPDGGERLFPVFPGQQDSLRV